MTRRPFHLSVSKLLFSFTPAFFLCGAHCALEFKISHQKLFVCFLSGILHDSVSAILPFKKGDHAQIPDYTDKTTVAENQDKESLLKEEILIDQLQLASWPLDKTVFDSLPPRLRKGMDIML